MFSDSIDCRVSKVFFLFNLIYNTIFFSYDLHWRYECSLLFIVIPFAILYNYHCVCYLKNVFFLLFSKNKMWVCLKVLLGFTPLWICVSWDFCFFFFLFSTFERLNSLIKIQIISFFSFG